MDKKNKGLIEFEKLLAKEGIDINDALEKKDLFEIPFSKKELEPVNVSKEELQQNLSDDSSEFKNQGIQQNVLDKLIKIKRTYEFNQGEIDLHGENIQTAQMKINEHLKKCYIKNIKYLLIITGKGSEGKTSPLRKLVCIMLKKFPIVEAFCYAKNHGGYGAFYVQIKN